MASSPSTQAPSRNAAQRLRAALFKLASTTSNASPTVTRLCELAGVSRNALYRYHPDVLRDLHKAQRKQQRKRGAKPATRAVRQLRDDNDHLRQQVAKLAALVDHYFAAWQEASALLQRRERELADMRKRFCPTVVSIKN